MRFLDQPSTPTPKRDLSKEVSEGVSDVE